MLRSFFWVHEQNDSWLREKSIFPFLNNLAPFLVKLITLVAFSQKIGFQFLILLQQNYSKINILILHEKRQNVFLENKKGQDWCQKYLSFHLSILLSQISSAALVSTAALVLNWESFWLRESCCSAVECIVNFSWQICCFQRPVTFLQLFTTFLHQGIPSRSNSTKTWLDVALVKCQIKKLTIKTV